MKKLIFLLLLMPLIAYPQKKWDKKLAKADADYTIGDYKKASKSLSKFKKKAVKKLGPENHYMPEYYLREARFNLATGAVIGFENTLELALEISKKINGASSLTYFNDQIEVASILGDYGYFSKARNYIEQVSLAVENTENYPDDLKAKIELNKSKILNGQGFYKEALEYINKSENYFSGRAVDRESYIDDSGKLKTRRLEDEEVRERYSQYAQLLTTKANIFRNKGDIIQADSAFIQAEIWINKNMGKDALEYVTNQYYNAKMFEENGMEELPRQLAYDKLLVYLKRKHKPSHSLAFELYESQLKEYVRQDKVAKFNGLAKEYEKAVKKNFKKNSIHRVILETIEFEEDLRKGKISKLYAEASGVLAKKSALPDIHKRTADLYEYMYRAAAANRNYKFAEEALNKILSIKKELYGEASPQYHLSKILYANYLIDFTDKVKEAGIIYEESFQQTVKNQINFRHKDYLDILSHMAQYYEITDQYEKASAALTEVKEAAIQKYDDSDYEYAIALEKIANLRINVGEYELAGQDIQKSLEILENFKKDEVLNIHYAKALETNAQLLAVKGYFDDAEDNLVDSEKIISKSDITSIDDLGAKEEKAKLFITLGRYNNANDELIEVLSGYGKLYGKSSSRLIKPLTHFGTLKLINGDYPDAEKYARFANDIAEKNYGKSSTKLAPSLRLLAEIYATIGDYDKAETYIKDAINILENRFGKNHIDMAGALSQYGLIKFYRGDRLDQTEKIVDEARNIILDKLGNRNPLYANALTDIAKIYISGHKYDDAFNALSLAETIWQLKTGKRNNINLATIHVLTGDIYYQQKNYPKAEEQYEKSRKLYNKFFNKDHPEYVKVISKLSKLYYMAGDYKKAKSNIENALESYNIFIKDYFPALSEREKAKFWNTIQPDYEFYNTLAFKLSSEDPNMVSKVYDNALLTKALLLNSSIKTRENILKSSDEELKAKFLLWMEKKEYLTNILSMSPEQLAANGIDPIGLNNEIEQLEKELSQKSQAFSEGFEKEIVDWKMVRDALKDNEVAIEMVRYRYFDHTFTDSVVYAVMYLNSNKKSTKPDVILLNNGQELESNYFVYYRNSIIYKVTDPHSYAQYWKPIEDKVGAHSTIYLSADGVFNQINLETIPVGEDKYVLDNSNIILVSNTKDIYNHKNKKPLQPNNKRAIMFGNPDYYLLASASNKINPLPGTEQEIITLQQMLEENGWEIDYYMENAASEDKVKMLDNPKIFHVATHGFYTPKEEQSVIDELVKTENSAAENPLLRTGLLLTGAGDLLDKTSVNYNMESGILTAYEAMNLNLDQTDLVVLSACETGLGDLAVGEGVYGLQRAFLVAGAKTLIMSMFKVDDQATQELMSTFYKKWLTTGNKRQSFIEAKKEIRNKYKEPIYWGAFIMIGLE